MPARRVLIYLALAGLLVRVIYLGQVADLPFFHDPVGDSARYVERAEGIVSGDLVGDRPFFYGGIFYPYLIALNILMFGRNFYAICLAQAIAGCALAWVLFETVKAAAPAKRGPGSVVALTAGGMALFYGPFAFFEADLLMISWTLLLVMGAALLVLRATGGPEGAGRPAARTACLVAAGVCLGLAASERPNLAALMPAFALWMMAVRRGGGLRGSLALLGGGTVILGGVALINHAASGQWVALTTSGGINFYIGNHAGARGTFDEPWSATETHFTARHTDLEESSLAMARRLSGSDLGPVEASRFWFARGMDHLRAEPAAAARLALRKLLLFWNREEVPNHLHYDFMRRTAPALRWLPLGFGLLAPLGLYGLVSRRSRRLMGRPLWSLLVLLVAVPTVSVLPFFVADRYRVPIVPPLILAAAFGVVSFGRMLAQEPSARRALAHLLSVGLAAVVVWWPLIAFDDARDHWLMAQAWKKRGELAEAVRHYEAALAIAPRDAPMRNNLGVVLAQMGDERRAEQEYRRAIADDPGLAFPRKNLGLMLMGQGRLEEAFPQLSAAEPSEPGDIEIARALAALYLARGDDAAAATRARRVLSEVPGDRTAAGVMEAVGRAQAP